MQTLAISLEFEDGVFQTVFVIMILVAVLRIVPERFLGSQITGFGLGWSYRAVIGSALPEYETGTDGGLRGVRHTIQPAAERL